MRLLLVVDYQNDFVDGTLGFADSQKIYQNLKNLIKEFIDTKDEIIFTLDTHDNNYFDTNEGKHLPIKHCLKNTDGHRLYKDIEKLAAPYVKIEKKTFGSKELFEVLKNKEYESIYVVGVVTNICVISNTIILKSIFPNTNIYVKKSCCASNDKKLEEETYDILKNLHIEVVD